MYHADIISPRVLLVHVLYLSTLITLHYSEALSWRRFCINLFCNRGVVTVGRPFVAFSTLEIFGTARVQVSQL